MSYYKKTNKDTASKLFYKRVYYDQSMKTLGMRNIINFYYGEKYLIGRVDTFYTPMILETASSLKEISNSAYPDSPQSALNFVADAFEQMTKDFKIAVRTNKIISYDKYLSDLKVYKSYEDPNVKYEEHYNSFASALIKKIRKDNLKITNFDEFAQILLTRIMSTDAIKRFPFTKAAFVKSRVCPMNISGLVIEIADESFANDDNKINKFVQSPNFSFYVQACNNNGFMIDRNAPWRLVADIRTPGMRVRAGAYIGPSPSTSIMLQNYYTLAGPQYYGAFKQRLLSLYNSVKKNVIILEDTCTTKTIKDFVVPQAYNLKSLQEEYPEEYFLRLYFNLRFEEEESSYSEAERESMIRDLISLYYTTRVNTAIIIFERILNKTFDYLGSMTYIMKARNGEISQGGGY
jgi:hypothetical protein